MIKQLMQAVDRLHFCGKDVCNCCTGCTLQIQHLSKTLSALFSSVLTLCQMEEMMTLLCYATEQCPLLWLVCRVCSCCLPMALQTKPAEYSCKATTPNDVLRAGLHLRCGALTTAAGQHRPG